MFGKKEYRWVKDGFGMFVANILDVSDIIHQEVSRNMRQKAVTSKKSPKQMVSGLLIPAKWDAKGNVVGVSIQAFDESEYIVRHVKRGKELLNFLNQKVAVSGKIFERLDGRSTIEIDHFTVIKDYAEV